MADGYEVFDTGHNKVVPRHQPLTEKQIRQVMVALRSLHLDSAEAARTVLFGPPDQTCGRTVRCGTSESPVVHCQRKTPPTLNRFRCPAYRQLSSVWSTLSGPSAP